MMRLSYLSPKTEVRESEIHGRGLFTTADMAKGEVVAVTPWDVLMGHPFLGHPEVPVEVVLDRRLQLHEQCGGVHDSAYHSHGVKG
jgi:hypothetical protein